MSLHMHTVESMKITLPADLAEFQRLFDLYKIVTPKAEDYSPEEFKHAVRQYNTDMSEIRAEVYATRHLRS